MKKGLVKNLVTLGLVGALIVIVLYTTFTNQPNDDYRLLFTTITTAAVTFYLGFQMNKGDHDGQV